jgi:hypothetical protein
MPDVLYFIWALLPIIQLIITMKAAGKKVTNIGRREDVDHYSKGLLFSVVGLLFAVFIDIKIYPSLAEVIEEYGIDSRIPRWLIYPAILTAIAVVQQSIRDKKQKLDEAEITARRLKYAKRKDF